MDVHGGNVLPGRSVYAHKPEATIGRDEAPLAETTPESGGNDVMSRTTVYRYSHRAVPLRVDIRPCHELRCTSPGNRALYAHKPSRRVPQSHTPFATRDSPHETALTRQPSRDSPHETALTRHRLRRSSAPRSHPPDFMRINNHSSTRRRTQDTPLSRSLRIAKPKPPQRPIKRNPTPISIAPHQAPRCRLATIQASPLLP